MCSKGCLCVRSSLNLPLDLRLGSTSENELYQKRSHTNQDNQEQHQLALPVALLVALRCHKFFACLMRHCHHLLYIFFDSINLLVLILYKYREVSENLLDICRQKPTQNPSAQHFFFRKQWPTAQYGWTQTIWVGPLSTNHGRYAPSTVCSMLAISASRRSISASL